MVERDVVRRFNPSFGPVRCVRLLKDLFHNNSYARDDQGGNPRAGNRGFDGVLYKL